MTETTTTTPKATKPAAAVALAPAPKVLTPLTITWGGEAEDGSGQGEYNGVSFAWNAAGQSIGSPSNLAAVVLTIPEPTLRSLSIKADKDGTYTPDQLTRMHKARTSLHPAQHKAWAVAAKSNNTVTQRVKETGEVSGVYTLRQIATATTKVQRNTERYPLA